MNFTRNASSNTHKTRIHGMRRQIIQSNPQISKIQAGLTLKQCIERDPRSFSITDWNKAINAFRSFQESVDWFGKLIQFVQPNTETFNKLLQRTGTLEEALTVLDVMENTFDLAYDSYTINIIMNKYCDTFTKAYEWYERIQEPLEVTETTLHVLAGKVQNMDEMLALMELFTKHKQPHTQPFFTAFKRVAKTRDDKALYNQYHNLRNN